MVSIEIDGRVIEAERGTMIIEAADSAGIAIPRFCYHKKLSIAANCRMCLVEVGNAPKPLPACATPVSEGMVVKTRSARARDAQKAVMEFLLINHPLDCPICDQGGECELQDVAMGYGQDVSRFTEGKRVVVDKDIGPFIATDLTRCIQCTRCVRFGEEIAGLQELGGLGRGEHMHIGTYVQRTIKSEISGNVIDLCPVGALTSKPFRFKARAWELLQYPGIAGHDCLGSNLYHHIYQSTVARVVPRENDAINEVWLSDRDRFSYEGYTHPERLGSPMIKRDDRWEKVDWSTAFSHVKAILEESIQKDGPEQIGAFISPNATLEEGYLFQKWYRGLGLSNLDHRLLQQDFRGQMAAPLYPSLNLSLTELATQQRILLIGSDICREQPLAAVRLRQAIQSGAQVFDINPIAFDCTFDVSIRMIPNRGRLATALWEIVAALNPAHPGCQKIIPSKEALAIAQALQQQQSGIIVLGEPALNSPDAVMLFYLAQVISSLTNLTVGTLTPGANSAGAWINGLLPHRGFAGAKVSKIGLNAKEMLEADLSTYLLFNIDPELDLLNSSHTLSALKKAKHVVAFTPYTSEVLEAHCDVLLPITPIAETSGTFVNANGEWQSFMGAAKPFGEARPAWKILRVLGNVFDLEGFDYNNSQEIVEAIRLNFNDKHFLREALLQPPKNGTEVESDNRRLTWIATRPGYLIDNVCRRATGLKMAQGSVQTAILNHHMACTLGIETAEHVRLINQKTGAEWVVDLKIEDAVPDGAIWTLYGHEQSIGFGCPYDPVVIVSQD